MTNNTVRNKLRQTISDILVNLIPGDYILADAPYYHNIGDILIWQGFHDFSATLPGRNQGTYDIVTFNFPTLNPDTTIILTGGGNFGDLWRHFQDFRLRVIERYPDNRIVMLPQSVWYDDKSLIDADAAALSRHKNLHLCARDSFSYDFMKEHFPTANIHIMPDMAVCISDDALLRYRKPAGMKKLFLKRLDKELDESSSDIPEISEYDVRDWPTYERQDSRLQLIKRMQGVSYRTRNIRPLNTIATSLTSTLAESLVRRHLLKTGVSFLSPYSEVLTTRLHTMILAFLMDIPVRYIDNTSGKLSAFAETWLKESPTVKKYKK